ncbi:MAE_28990/MAE_18760 family HEPN-like nuclease [Myxococcus landrumensis]|uniref:RiboL-PSP-HEPN domain-containing protein n=1 Tax=Myxococcus landrumensis TaxID=2813577 RepID=A0ABX7NFM9_9BACT|nr:MAE_28990/MAE_18760 family HEPN-like nuclease [Myxococcus landrumus]QSQ17478.1 hypothetical protein JY572_16160 [Myxococcus landrumus]
MDASLATFNQELHDLRHHIHGLEIESRLMSVPAQPTQPAHIATLLKQFQDHRAGATAKRRFDYTSIIISLYGALEHYIETLLQEHLTRISALVPTYLEIPETIRTKHVPLTAELLGRLEHQKYRNRITPEFLIGNLHSCLSTADKYRLNIDAFCHHGSNFRSETIESYFKQTGIENLSKQIRSNASFSDYYQQKNQALPPDDISFDLLFAPINDLAERRNEVAHGSPSELLSNELLLALISFVEVYGKALHTVVRQSLLPWEVQYRGQTLGQPIQVYNNSIVCLNINNIPITQGDWLIAQPANPNAAYLEGVILEIQIANATHDKIHPQTKTAVAFRVDYSAKKNQTFYLIQQDKRL